MIRTSIKTVKWWRWLLLPLSPIAVPIAFIIGLIKGSKQKKELEDYIDKDWFEQKRKETNNRNSNR